MRFYNIERSHCFVEKTLVEIKDVDKTYNVTGFGGKIVGEIKALKNLNLKIKKGEIFGFLGKNGAGKTTTIKCLMGILTPDSGKIEVEGISIQEFPIDVKQKMGYVPEKIGLYEGLTPREIVEYLGRFHQINEMDLKEKSQELFEIFGLEKHLEKKIEHLSMGLKKRVALVCSLVNNPELLVLDEPMSGLDPESTVALRESLIRLNKKGLTIFFSSHQLTEVQKLCSKVGIINVPNAPNALDIYRTPAAITLRNRCGYALKLNEIKRGYSFPFLKEEYSLVISSASAGTMKSSVEFLSIWRKNRNPNPFPSAAPSIIPGISAIIKDL